MTGTEVGYPITKRVLVESKFKTCLHVNQFAIIAERLGTVNGLINGDNSFHPHVLIKISTVRYLTLLSSIVKKIFRRFVYVPTYAYQNMIIKSSRKEPCIYVTIMLQVSYYKFIFLAPYPVLTNPPEIIDVKPTSCTVQLKNTSYEGLGIPSFYIIQYQVLFVTY